MRTEKLREPMRTRFYQIIIRNKAWWYSRCDRIRYFSR